jgi:predicted ATP-grasp superfamily ATP-dependent carboligase
VRILVYEFASGGGLAGRDIPRSLAREGAAMRAALVTDLSAIGSHEIVTTGEARVDHDLPAGVEVVVLPDGEHARASALDRLIDAVDGVWLIAPESDRCLERLAAMVARHGKTLFGPAADAIDRASDKARLPQLLASAGVRHPLSRALHVDGDARAAADAVGCPLVAKPARGAGSHGLSVATTERAIPRAVATARRAAGGGMVVLQQFVPGTAASVSALADGRDAVALALNAQRLRSSPPFSYEGGETPLDHPLAPRAIEAALGACRAVRGLRGLVGVDLILTDRDAVVIEVNPRLTTAYLGVRAAIDENLAALALAACGGDLAPPPAIRRCVRFTASGQVVVAAGHRGSGAVHV